MAKLLATGATLSCTKGASTCVFRASGLSGAPLVAGSASAGTTTDFAISNISTFGMCSSMSNPQVAAATAAAKKLTQMPCVPKVVSAWSPSSVVAGLSGVPFATAQSKCNCAYGGMISVKSPFAGPEDTE